MQQAEIIGHHFAHLFVIEVQQAPPLRMHPHQCAFPAVVIAAANMLRPQRPRNVHRAETAVLPHMHQFVDQNGIRQIAPAFDYLKPHVRKPELPGSQMRPRIYTHLIIINVVTKNRVRQLDFPPGKCAPPWFDQAVDQHQQVGYKQHIQHQKHALEQPPADMPWKAPCRSLAFQVHHQARQTWPHEKRMALRGEMRVTANDGSTKNNSVMSKVPRFTSKMFHGSICTGA